MTTPAQTDSSGPVPNASAGAFVAEGLPPHLQFRVQESDTRSVPPGAETGRGLIYQLKQWPPEISTLKVCFFGGSDALRRRIVTIAQHWTQAPLGISFDFGSSAGRSCVDQQQYEVRVGFRYAGYWSLIGQDSRLANQNEQTVNLRYFDVAPPPEPEFTRRVLHEFGHVLGLRHEQQNPSARCWDQYDWPKLNAFLMGAPNFWSDDEIKLQMRQISEPRIKNTPFDRDSIMLYYIPAAYFKEQDKSGCYAEAADDLSAGDRAFVASIYPLDTHRLASARNALVEQYLATVQKNVPDLQQVLAAYVEVTKLTQGKLPQTAIVTLHQEAMQRPDVILPPELRAVKPIT